MSCTFFDFGCHAAGVASDLWGGLSLPSKLLIVLGLLSIVGGALWGAGQVLKRFAGWPGVAGGVALLLGLLLAVLPRPRGEAAPSAPAKKPEFQFGVERLRPKKKRPTIFDMGRR